MSDNFNFESLEVYKRSLKLSVEMCKLGQTIPNSYSRLRDQLIGAVISIPLNIAEGSGRFSPKDQNNFYKFGKTSAFECIPILGICKEINFIDENSYNVFRKELWEISKMLSGLMRRQRPEINFSVVGTKFSDLSSQI